MSIADGFARYTTQELRAEIKYLEECLANANARICKYRKAGHGFKEICTELEEYIGNIEGAIHDVRCAYLVRIN